MSLTAIVLSALAALVFLLAGTQKVLLRPQVSANLLRLGVGPAMTRSIGVLEIAGALGLMVGVWARPLAVVAAIGLTLLLFGAIGYHLRARDFSREQHRSHAAAPVLLALLTSANVIALLMAP
ncbi:DoxX family protein [Nonomuraea sp. B12E4]|uniref:DoxX family protein n=1 Tax=Nonomuraea sp. B12E4 TaxID=3153564 RepID=UPI00325EE122